MSAFELFLRMGVEHIADWRGYDHIVFLIALCATYTFKDWKKVLLIITFFTIGHTLTLFLAAFKVVEVKAAIIEFAIAATIFITAFANLNKKAQNPKSNLKVWLGALFGLIHGLGFSRYYIMIAESTDLWVSLSSFTLGIELGQLLIVLGFMIFAWLIENALSTNRKDLNLIFSGSAIGIALVMMLERLPELL